MTPAPSGSSPVPSGAMPCRQTQPRQGPNRPLKRSSTASEATAIYNRVAEAKICLLEAQTKAVEERRMLDMEKQRLEIGVLTLQRDQEILKLKLLQKEWEKFNQ